VEWLQQLDATVFRFINQTLSNPLFDKLMPFLSGNVFFAPAVVIAAFLMIWKDRLRGGLCVLMLALIVWPGDSFITDPIRDTIRRPRPFVTMPETRLPAGHGGKLGMPSSHAANWGAATMILFIYYRRSLWITAPLAFAVCFSRVYNGVHYPGDVLAGSMLGASYAAILVFTFDAVWRWLGRMLFPSFLGKLPTLIARQPSTRPGNRENSADETPQT
jgi:undecaprenyl-diphosphatase